jgi:hypothetical protein
VIVCNILFLSQLHKEFNKKLKIVLIYVTLMMLTQIGNIVDFENFDVVEDTLFFIAVILSTYVMSIGFLLINKRNYNLIIQEEVDENEFRIYKEMFNSLQEGILVIDEQIQNSEENNERIFSLFFVN